MENAIKMRNPGEKAESINTNEMTICVHEKTILYG